MIPLVEIAGNTISSAVADMEGLYFVSAACGLNDRVWPPRQRAANLNDDLCEHRAEVLCSCFDAVREAGGASLRSFEHIACATALYDAALNTGRALRSFDECWRVYDARLPGDVTGRHPGGLADLISDLAASAAGLEDAIKNLRRLLERA